MQRMAIIDFEASCLPEDRFSFPIEVALAKVDGPSRTWLIRPSRRWLYWDWCEAAEAIHGIGRERLEREGLPVAQVLAELISETAGYTVYADSDLDAYWLETLATACGAPPPFPILYLGELFQQRGFNRQQVLSALDTARGQMPIEHVARADARRLALVLRQLGARNSGGWRRSAAA